MLMMRSLLLILSLAAPALATAEVRLYTLDCGHATFKDMGGFSDTGEYDGKPGSLVAPCFLIKHDNAYLLWDSGLGDRFAAKTESIDSDYDVFGDGSVMILRAP
jgi:N-acyl homoserine lactone hydrolase